MLRNLLPVVACLFVFACGGEKVEQADVEPETAETLSSVTGTVEFRERVGLTPESRLEIVLQDVSLADAPATEIARKIVEQPGQSPIEFSIEYDSSLIDERHTYSVGAKVFDRDQLIFISDTINPVITRGAPTQITVQTVRAVSSKRDMPDVPFVGTTWLLTTIAAAAVVDDPEYPAPYLLASSTSQLGGHGGCNRFNGGYNLTGNTIAIGNLAVTMMACPGGGDTEQLFMAALGEMDAIRIDGRTLLAFSEGAVIAAFEAK